MEIETDKTAVPIPSPVNGVVEAALVADGTTVKAGQELVKITVGAAPPPKAAGEAPAKPPPAPEPSGKILKFLISF